MKLVLLRVGIKCSVDKTVIEDVNVDDVSMEDVMDERALKMNISKRKKCVDKGQSGAK